MIALRAEREREAREALSSIAAEIDRVPDDNRQPIDLALFWAYIAGSLDDDASTSAFQAATQTLIAHVDARNVPTYALHDGLAGAGWVLSHISDGAIGGLDVLDTKLAARIDLVRDCDLIYGLAGDAIYFLERHAANAPTAPATVTRIVDRIAALATRAADGVTWFKPASQLVGKRATESPNGHYDCGVAHGAPGVIAALARIATTDGIADTTRTLARSLAIDSMTWMQASVLSPHPRGRLPPWRVDVGTPLPPSGSGWCYGEPGVAVVLWVAAARLGVPHEPWHELALDSARRSIADSDVSTPGLCHGTAGLAHLYDRCFRATGDGVFADAVDRWVDQTLAMRRPGRGPGGFTLSPTTDEGSQQLLFGACGIGLALASIVGTGDPAWDRLLGCDLPSRRRFEEDDVLVATPAR